MRLVSRTGQRHFSRRKHPLPDALINAVRAFGIFR